MRLSTKFLVLFVLCASSLAGADPPPPISAFARRPAVANVRISPEGRYLLYLTTVQGEPMAVTVDRRNGDKKTVVVRQGDTRAFYIRWCAWGNEARVLCGLSGTTRDRTVYPTSRLVAVNADSSGFKILDSSRTTSRDVRIGMAYRIGRISSTQYQDEVIDFTPAQPDTVLLQVPVDNSLYPSVCEMNIYNGHTRVLEESVPPILDFYADGRGQVRLGAGLRDGDTRLSFLTRLEGEKSWHLFAAFDAFERRDQFTPLQVAESNKVYAMGPTGNRQGLWEVDLEGKQKPRLLFSHPDADVSDLILTNNKRLLGVAYETDRPSAHYLDARAKSVIAGANAYLPDTYNEIVDVTADEKIYVLRSRSDVDAGSFHLLDVSSGSGELEFLGRAYPELDPKILGRMQSIRYEARDGTQIPGYLTLPLEPRPAKLPVVVLPHDGPDARDSWEFDYLRLFLVSRGFAVLQMNFRGSAGYGWDWQHAAHQNWAGLAHQDITDGARWAATQNFADPQRMCIVGRGFGGYAALLSAQREDTLYRCAVSIAGPTDLAELKDDAKFFMQSGLTREEIGGGREKLRADSPLWNAATIDIPVLMIHGTRDWVTGVDHSRKMAAALKREGKPHELIVLEGAEHDFRWESDRAQLLESVEKFLGKHLNMSTTPASATEARP